MADGMLLDLSAQIKGTTAVAFFNRNTIKAIVDSTPESRTRELLKEAINGKQKGLQIFRVYIVEKEVKNEQIYMFASFGTGSPYANQLMVHGYNFNFSDDAAKNFAQKIVFNASFYDKNTDGNLHYFEVTEQGWDEEEQVHALETYSSFYEQYDENSTLFLVHNAKEVVPTDDLVALFRPHGDIIIGHVVDHRVTSTNKGFYFHRLVFVSKEEAEKVLTHMENSLRDDIYNKSLILSQFTYQLNWKNESLFVQKASRQLLDYIIHNSTMKLDYSPY
ncbi:hypothetical protein ACLB2K_024701 [Fragaria x ananassa]